jgi:hypothetical protein
MTERVAVHHADGTTQIITTVHSGFASRMRRFVLDRTVDVSGISGTGIVAEGVRFSDGRCVIRWVVGLQSTAIYDCMEDLLAIHGHNGSTQLSWVDEEYDDGG